MKIALIYDWVNKFGGAERVLLAIHEIWPKADLFTAFYNKTKAPWAKVFNVNTSILKYLPVFSSLHEIFPLLTPVIYESFKLDDYDLVISVTSSDAKAIITKPETLHVNYCLTPTRYLWSGYRDYIKEPGLGFFNLFTGFFLKLYSPSLRRWDQIASLRPDKFIAISKTVRSRIKAYYKRDSLVIYPPVDTDFFKPKAENSQINREVSIQDYYLIISRLVPYKKIDYVIYAFNKLGKKLIIAGNGIDEKRLRKLAGPAVKIVSGNLTDEKLCWYYQNCKGFIFPGEEDFGIAAVEAQACGKPVLSLGLGGGREIVIPEITGEVYEKADENIFLDKFKLFSNKKYSMEACRQNALRFSKRRFISEFKNYINKSYKDWNREKQ